MEIDRNLPVLITGATGYVAGWVVKHFLEEGFTVHAAIRDAGNENKRQHLDQIANNCDGKSNFLSPIYSMRFLQRSNGRMPNCCAYCFTILLETKDPQRDLIDPALKEL